ncbi:hypothetical protein G9A89_021285 [Geosiphon pyriformis]|nr:hypothetical protein G9A89_021285 [Geosiphon pyriformis]
MLDQKKTYSLSYFQKNLLVTWNKIKDHSSVIGNNHANFYADALVISKSFLPFMVPYYFLNIEGKLVFGNAYYVAKKLFNAVYSVGWKTRCVNDIISVDFCSYFNKAKIFCVWHSDDKIRSGYTCTVLVALQLYFIKVFHYCLHVTKRKKIYNPKYLSIACIWCNLVKNSDYMFSYAHNINVQKFLLFDAILK